MGCSGSKQLSSGLQISEGTLHREIAHTIQVNQENTKSIHPSIDILGGRTALHNNNKKWHGLKLRHQKAVLKPVASGEHKREGRNNDREEEEEEEEEDEEEVEEEEEEESNAETQSENLSEHHHVKHLKPTEPEKLGESKNTNKTNLTNNSTHNSFNGPFPSAPIATTTTTNNNNNNNNNEPHASSFSKSVSQPRPSKTKLWLMPGLWQTFNRRHFNNRTDKKNLFDHAQSSTHPSGSLSSPIEKKPSLSIKNGVNHVSSNTHHQETPSNSSHHSQQNTASDRPGCLTRSRSSKLSKWLNLGKDEPHNNLQEQQNPDGTVTLRKLISTHEGRRSELFTLKRLPIAGQYDIGRVLGRGSFGEVRSCVHRASGRLMAVKIMQKFPTKASRGGNNVDFAAMFYNEIHVLSRLSHPNVIGFEEAFEGQTTLYAVIEHCDSGDLFQHILKCVREHRHRKKMLAAYIRAGGGTTISSTSHHHFSSCLPSTDTGNDNASSSFSPVKFCGPTSETEVAELVRALLQPLIYLHSKRCAHRDIKAQNFLFSSIVVTERDEHQKEGSSTLSCNKIDEFGVTNCSVTRSPTVLNSDHGTLIGRSTPECAHQKKNSLPDFSTCSPLQHDRVAGSSHCRHPARSDDVSLPTFVREIRTCPVVSASSPSSPAESQAGDEQNKAETKYSVNDPTSKKIDKVSSDSFPPAGSNRNSSSSKYSGYRNALGDKRVVLIDFGMSSFVPEGGQLKTLCGSPHYVAPEILTHSYGLEVDMWAFGVIVYLIIYGRYPFDGADRNSILKKIQRHPVSFPTSPQGPNPKAVDFLKGCLTRNPRLRLTAAQALQHPWLQPGGSNDFYHYPVIALPPSFGVNTTSPSNINHYDHNNLPSLTSPYAAATTATSPTPNKKSAKHEMLHHLQIDHRYDSEEAVTATTTATSAADRLIAVGDPLFLPDDGTTATDNQGVTLSVTRVGTSPNILQENLVSPPESWQRFATSHCGALALTQQRRASLPSPQRHPQAIFADERLPGISSGPSEAEETTTTISILNEDNMSKNDDKPHQHSSQQRRRSQVTHHHSGNLRHHHHSNNKIKHSPQ